MSRFFLLLLLAPPLGASPNDDQKHPEEIALVRKLYEEARSGNGGEILEKYADRSLKEAFAAETRFHESTGSICIDADPVWESQDPITDVKVEVRPCATAKSAPALSNTAGWTLTTPLIVPAAAAASATWKPTATSA